MIEGGLTPGLKGKVPAILGLIEKCFGMERTGEIDGVPVYGYPDRSSPQERMEEDVRLMFAAEPAQRRQRIEMWGQMLHSWDSSSEMREYARAVLSRFLAEMEKRGLVAAHSPLSPCEGTKDARQIGLRD